MSFVCRFSVDSTTHNRYTSDMAIDDGQIIVTAALRDTVIFRDYNGDLKRGYVLSRPQVRNGMRYLVSCAQYQGGVSVRPDQIVRVL